MAVAETAPGSSGFLVSAHDALSRLTAIDVSSRRLERWRTTRAQAAGSLARAAYFDAATDLGSDTPDRLVETVLLEMPEYDPAHPELATLLSKLLSKADIIIASAPEHKKAVKDSWRRRQMAKFAGQTVKVQGVPMQNDGTDLPSIRRSLTPAFYVVLGGSEGPTADPEALNSPDSSVTGILDDLRIDDEDHLTVDIGVAANDGSESPDELAPTVIRVNGIFGRVPDLAKFPKRFRGRLLNMVDMRIEPRADAPQ